jgi:hypothetical protein
LDTSTVTSIGFAAPEVGGEVAAIFRTQDHFAGSLGLGDCACLDRLAQLGELATIQCLLSEARDLTGPMPAVQFRAATRSPFGVFGTLLYGDKTAVVVTNGADHIFHVIKSVQIARNGWKDFSPCWKDGFPLALPAAPPRKRA